MRAGGMACIRAAYAALSRRLRQTGPRRIFIWHPAIYGGHSRWCSVLLHDKFVRISAKSYEHERWLKCLGATPLEVGASQGAETGDGDLFRGEVLQAQRGQWMGAINLATPQAFVWWALLAASFAAAIVLFLIFGHYTRRTEVTGQLQPSAGMLILPAQSTGTVHRTLVHEGERVKAGQPLVEISADLVSVSMGDTHAVVSAQLRARQAQIRTTLANLRPQAKEQARDLRTRIGLLQAQVRQIDGQLTLQREQAATATSFVGKIKPVLE